VILFLVFVPITILNASTNPITTESALSKIKFESVNGLIVIEAAIDGSVGDYIFDTGTSQIVINQEVKKGNLDLWTAHGEFKSKELLLSHFQKGNLDLWTAHGEFKSKELVLRQFQCGNIKRQSISALAMNLSFVEGILKRPVAGIIGNELLKDFRVLIDYDNNELCLLPISKSRTDFNPSDFNIASIPFQEVNDHITVELEVGGKVNKYIFDTGAGISVMKTDTRANDSNETPPLRHADVSINQISVDNVPFIEKSLDTWPISSDSAVNGILSVHALNTSKVLIDYSTSKIHMFWDKPESGIAVN